MLENIISGGQAGIDQAALDAAIQSNIPHGGWCPKGRICETGVIPERFQLVESKTSEYPERTKLNVKDSDGTLIIVPKLPLKEKDGTYLTVEFAKDLKKPLYTVDLNNPPNVKEMIDWIQKNKIKILNVAGPRESKSPGIYKSGFEFLTKFFEACKTKQKPDLPMPIETPRLIIRPIRLDDAKAINEAVLETFETLHHFMDWAAEKPTLEDTETHAKNSAINWIHQRCEEPWLQLAIIDKETNEFVGGTSFHHIDWNIPSVEIGYWIRTSRAKQGLMTEAINAMTQYAFKQLNVNRIAITCDKNNLRSKKIPERLGYTLEATLKNHRRFPATGALSHTLLYARYNGENLPELKITWTSKINLNPADLTKLTEDDINEITEAFKKIGWNKPAKTYESYLEEQLKGQRTVFIAKVSGKFAGYVTLKYESDYLGLKATNIPEIVDLNVLPVYQNKGIGTALINACESLAKEKGCKKIGIGVGMTADYGSAQRLYVKLGYVPDKKGMHYQNNPVKYGEKIMIDDDVVLYFWKKFF